MKLKNVNRIISFNQKPWIKEYIDHNTNLRTLSKTDFEEAIWKLMNYSFFGKAMENIRKRENIELETNPERARKQTSKPIFKRFSKFSDNLHAIHKYKGYITLKIY